MKKLSIYLFALVAMTSMFLTSCGGDEDPKVIPTVSFIPADEIKELAANATHSIAVTYKAAEKIKTITVYKIDGSNKTTHIAPKTSGFDSDTQHLDAYELAGPASGEIKYEFEVEDKAGSKASKTITLKVAGVEAGLINTYSAKLLGNQANQTKGSFLATSNGTVYLSADAKTNSSIVDLVYYYGASNLATIAAPSNSDAQSVFASITTWTTKNATMFKATNLTGTNFDSYNNDANIITAADGANLSQLTQLSAGQVFAFVTAAGKKGLVKVTSITGTNTATGEINIDVKVQK